MKRKGCIFISLGVLLVLSAMLCIQVKNKKNLDNWLGRYYYCETYPHNSGELSYVIEYTITIYKDENKYYAQIVGDGWHTMARYLAQVTGDRNKIDISYLQRLPDDALYGCERDAFPKGEVLWRFEREENDLNTVWLAGKKFFLSFEDMESEITVKSFEKVAETAGVQYEYWADFSYEKNLPYAGRQTFEAVRGFYSEIDFFGEFQKGDTEVYGEYREAFLKLLQNEMPFRNRESDENVYLKDFGRFKEKYAPQELEYYFFDMNEDGFPELTIENNWDTYIFQYDAKADAFVLWYSMESGWYSLIGSRKVMWLGEGKYLAFYLLDQEGEAECETFFLANWFNEEESLYVVMVPQYHREAGRITVTEDMKAEGIYERYSGQWYFRVTEEQWYELADIYLEAERTAREKIKDVTYTYEELFGSLVQ